MAANGDLRPRVAILTNVPSPYQVEFFNAVARDGSLDLKVWYCADWDRRRSWTTTPPIEHAHRIGRAWRVAGRRDHYYLDPAPAAEMVGWRPHLAILSVYTMPSVQLAMWRATRARIPWAYWGERVAAGVRSGPVRLLRRAALFPIARYAVGTMAVGSRAVAGFRELFGSAHPILNVPYFSALRRLTGAVKREPGEAGTTFLYVGAFTRRKGMDVLARAFNRVVAATPSVRLIAVGDGDAAGTFTAYLSPDALRRVEVRPFVGWADLPSVYSLGDVLVFPSRYDGWGMVVPEAMASGLPVIGSTAAGATCDLVREGLTGWQVPPDDEVALAGSMGAALRLPANGRWRMGAACRARARRYDTEVGVRVFRSAVSRLTQESESVR